MCKHTSPNVRDVLVGGGSDAQLEGIRASGADMRNCILHRACLDSAQLAGAVVLGSSWKEVSSPAVPCCVSV
jgi:uncharacterized protein YjbI with pentapeptide repeats